MSFDRETAWMIFTLAIASLISVAVVFATTLQEAGDKTDRRATSISELKTEFDTVTSSEPKASIVKRLISIDDALLQVLPPNEGADTIAERMIWVDNDT